MAKILKQRLWRGSHNGRETYVLAATQTEAAQRVGLKLYTFRNRFMRVPKGLASLESGIPDGAVLLAKTTITFSHTDSTPTRYVTDSSRISANLGRHGSTCARRKAA